MLREVGKKKIGRKYQVRCLIKKNENLADFKVKKEKIKWTIDKVGVFSSSENSFQRSP